MHVLLDHQCVINTSPRLKKALPNPLLIAYRRPPNLKYLSVREAYGQVKETYTRNSRCRQPLERPFGEGSLWLSKRNLHGVQPMSTTTLQDMHPHKNGCDNPRSTSTGQTFKVKASADCCTKNVVYVIECKKCAVQYVGETENALRVQLTGHRSDITHQRTDRPVARHFCQSHHSIHDLTRMAVEKIHRIGVNFRWRKESHWISVLRTLTPDGLNINLQAMPSLLTIKWELVGHAPYIYHQ